MKDILGAFPLLNHHLKKESCSKTLRTAYTAIDIVEPVLQRALLKAEAKSSLFPAETTPERRPPPREGSKVVEGNNFRVASTGRSNKNTGDNLSHELKTLFFFPLNPGWLIRILIMVYYNPYLQTWVV